ncbi:hypothetical protein RN001_015487 [Aquatica leii]|uniref:Uncharacterized protein n=1 Tax=Aquatica leii TaxID=1421715 RepID=A0AAN7P1V8_9COLE|nr:hypothetical protein RN001_015487 [Aquatica leii]
MTDKQKERCSVSSSLTSPDQGSGQTSYRTRGAKNTWKRLGCQLYIGRYNARTLGEEDKLKVLHYELNKINWDIVGLAKVRRKGENCLKLKLGHILFYKGDENRSIGDVGVLVHKKMVP